MHAHHKQRGARYSPHCTAPSIPPSTRSQAGKACCVNDVPEVGAVATCSEKGHYCAPAAGAKAGAVGGVCTRCPANPTPQQQRDGCYGASG